MENNELENLEKTKEIDTLSDFIPDERDEDLVEEMIPTEKGKKGWKKLSKKGKIIIIIGASIILIVIIALILLLLKKEPKKEVEKPKPIEPEEVVIVKDNYKYKEGTLIFLNEVDEEIGEYECTNKDENLCFVSYNSPEENYDTVKNIDEEGNNVPIRTTIILNNYVFINDNKDVETNLIKLYDITKKEEIEAYQLVKVKNDYAILKNTEGKFGLVKYEMDKTTTVMDFKYDNLGFLKDNVVGLRSKKYVLYGLDGKSKSKGLNNAIKDYNESYISTIDSKNIYSLYDYEGNKVTKNDYNFIKLLNQEYMVTVKDNNLLIKDYKENKMMEQSIILENTIYNKTNTYDKDNKIIDTKVAFEIEMNEEMYSINYSKDNELTTKTINILEGKISNNYKYVSYFDNKLYFYDDEAKNNLIGTYTCTNKNVLTSESTEFTSCIIARDDNSATNDLKSITSKKGYLPIINKAYVFIKDVPQVVSNATMNIVLYDLVNKEAKVKYKKVKSEYYNNTDISLVDTDNTYIIVQNKNDKYGLIKINKTGVEGSINFNYTDMENLGDFISVKTASNTYKVINNKGEDVTTSFSGKVMNINSKYVTVFSNNSYKIYELNGNVLNSGEFKYIDLKDKYYITITDDYKLNAYSNTSPTTKLFDDLTLHVTNNLKNGSAYTSKVENNKLTITIYKSDKTTSEHSVTLSSVIESE